MKHFLRFPFSLTFKSLHYSSIALLSILALIQILLLFTEFNHRRIPIPNFIFQSIDAQLAEHELSTQYSKSFFNISGEVEIYDLTLNYKNLSDPILKADRIKIELSLFQLLLSNVIPKKITVDNATILSPPIFSPTGINQTIFNNIFLKTSIHKNTLLIEQFSSFLDSLHIIASGTLNLNAFQDNSDFKITKYFHLLSKIIENTSTFHLVSNPILHISVNTDPQNAIFAALNIYFDSFKHTTDFSTGKTLIKTHAHFKDQLLTLDKTIFVDTNNIAWKKIFSCETASFLIKDPVLFFDKKNIQFPSFVHAILNNASITDEKNISINCEVDFSLHPIIHPTIHISNNSEWLLADLFVDLLQKNLEFYLSGNTSFSSIHHHLPALIKKSPYYPKLQGKLAFSSSGELSYIENTPNFKNIALSASANHFSLNNAPFDNLYLESNVSPSNLDIQNIFIESPDSLVQGSFSKNFTNNTTRYLLSGQINPKHLNYWLDPWWSDLWKKFKLLSSFPKTNIDILLTDISPTLSETSIFGDILADHFEYKNIPFKNIQFILNKELKSLELNNLNATLPNGRLDGSIRWNYKETEQKTLVSTYVDGSTQIPLEQLDTLAENPSLHEILKSFNCYKPPFLSIKGLKHSNPIHDHFDVQFNAQSSLYYKNFPLDKLYFDANYKNKSSSISNINFGFATGSGSASVILTKAHNSASDRFSLNLNLVNAQQDLAIKHLKEYFTQSKLPVNQLTHYGGNINLNAKLTGLLGNLNSFSGNGNIHILDADFGKINLFGFISQLSSAGSFQLTDAQSSFSVNHGFVEFPDLNIFGPSVNIKSQGRLNLSSHEIDFLMDIDPLGRGKRPIISQALLILTPITQSFQVKLTGTVENPQWNASLTPLGLFKQKSLK